MAPNMISSNVVEHDNVLLSSSSSVEKAILNKSIYTKDMYAPTEKTRTFVVDSFPLLGKVVAYRFIEWVIANPEGVCALPTGKTPEYFIKWTQRIVKEWDTTDIKEDRRMYGLDGYVAPPRFDKLWFVMLDEFYPMHPEHHNSFKYYVSNYYINGLGFDPERCLYIDLSKLGLHDKETLEDVWPDGSFVDLSLRLRTPTTPLEIRQQEMIRQVDQWCLDYESKIRSLGGIGFFLGGIGPDGHIAFNVCGSDHRSTTRLAQLNYPTQAAASADLGGIDAVKAKCAITIGLGTITYNPDCVCILIAAGEAKAPMVANGVQEETNIKYPSHAIRVLPNAAFYVTKGAAKLLVERNIVDLKEASNVGIEDIEKILVDVSVSSRKRLVDLDTVDVNKDPMGKVLMDRMGWSKEDLHDTCRMVTERLISKIGKGTETLTNTTFMHIEPHNDDIMLGYLPSVIRQTRPTSNDHYFVCATSGFNSVSNAHIRKMIRRARKFIAKDSFRKLVEEGYFLPKPDGTSSIGFMNVDTPSEEHYQLARSRDVWQYLDGVSSSHNKDGNDDEEKSEGSARRFIRNIIEIYALSHCDDDDDLHDQVETKLNELDEYFDKVYPGQPDVKDVQMLKGCCREFESECAWGSLGWLPTNVANLRLGFYTSDIFTPEPTLERDSKPVLDALLKAQPDIVTVAFDPEASGPDTHYKVLQAVTEALKMYQSTIPEKPIKVWGYRNVWYRFDTSEITHIVPSSLSSLGSLDRMFMTNFESQTAAEFPSYELDGPFSELAARIQVEQYKNLKISLGRKWFQEHSSALIRATKGLVYFKEMSVPELEKYSRALRSRAEQY